MTISPQQKVRDMAGRSVIAAALTGSVVVLVLNWHGAWAQQQQSPMQPPGKEYVLRATSADIEILGNALRERPYKEVAALLAKFQQQIIEQDRPQAPPAAPQPPTTEPK